jgi:hypothetical protein
MDIGHKLELLKETYSEPDELDRLVGKLLEVALSQHKLRLERYDRDLREFEQRYGMESAAFTSNLRRENLGMLLTFLSGRGCTNYAKTSWKKLTNWSE